MMEYVDKIVVGGLATAVAWLFRTVMTNGTKVAVVQSQIEDIKKGQDRQEKAMEKIDAKLDRLAEKKDL